MFFVYFLFSLRATCLAHRIILNLIILIISGEECKLWSASLCSFRQPRVVHQHPVRLIRHVEVAVVMTRWNYGGHDTLKLRWSWLIEITVVLTRWNYGGHDTLKLRWSWLIEITVVLTRWNYGGHDTYKLRWSWHVQITVVLTHWSYGGRDTLKLRWSWHVEITVVLTRSSYGGHDTLKLRWSWHMVECVGLGCDTMSQVAELLAHITVA
jgi:uncharacterized ubiquitin-like protein YukD